MRKFLVALPWVLAVIFALLFLSTYYKPLPTRQTLPPTSPQPEAGRPLDETTQTSEILVTKVIDGDTIEIEGETRVRYIGIDTPESDECFDTQATEANKALVASKRVQLETDVQKLDKYQRTLAYVWVGNTMVNEELVAQGFATVSTFPPNVRYVDRFTKAQQQAHQAQLGLWAPDVCKNQAPTPGVEPQSQGPQPVCAIKGNISSSGEKIYHMPGQRYYEKTKIEEDKGEQWFCTEDEAISTGWRKSKI